MHSLRASIPFQVRQIPKIQCLRPLRHQYHTSRHSHRTVLKRQYSTNSPHDAAEQKRTSRAERILAKLPRWTHKYTARLRGAPATHVAAFLVLHEVTAVAPLLALFGLFHYTSLAPVDAVMGSRYGAYAEEGARRAERYFRRKGWFGFSAQEGDSSVAVSKSDATVAESQDFDGVDGIKRRWSGADTRYKAVVEVALAYAITKALFPARILVSVWATPWFAGRLVALRRLVSRKS
jgi:hypothetical protein